MNQNDGESAKISRVAAVISMLLSCGSMGAFLGMNALGKLGLPAKLDRLSWDQWPQVLLGSAMTLMIWGSVSVAISLGLKISFRETLLSSSVGFLPLLSLLVASLQNELFLTDPSSFLMVMAWIGCGVAVWYRIGHRFGFEIFKQVRPGAWTMGLACMLIAVVWAGGGMGPRRHPVGDEPAYLMITHSMAQDQDINMNDDYLAQAYRRFYSGRYPMFTHLGFDGVNYPHHSPGLPFLLAPVYAVALWWGSNAVLVFLMRLCMGILFGLCALETYRLAESLNETRSGVFGAVAACFWAGPLVFFSVEIYPEILTALLLIVSVRQLFFSKSSDWIRFGWPGFSVAYLPWLGIKYIPTAGVLFLITIFQIWRGKVHLRRRFIFAGVLVMMSGLLYVWFLYSHYRNLNPAVIYSGVIPGTGTAAVRPGEPGFWEQFPLSFKNFWIFLLGMVLEQRIGILFFAPIYILAIPGMIRQVKQKSDVAISMILLMGIHIVLYGWQNNWGGYCPPNRQFIAVAPLLICFVAAGWQAIQGKFANVFKRGSAIYGWSLAFLLMHHERWLYHTMNPHLEGGEANILRAFSPDYGINLPKYFPLLMGDIRQWMPTLIWSLIFISLAIYLSWIGRLKLPSRKMKPGILLHTWIAVWITGLTFCWYFIPPGSFIVDFNDRIYTRQVILNDNHLGQEKDGFWVKGCATAEMLLGFKHNSPKISVDLYSLVPNVVWVNLGGSLKKVMLDGQNHGMFIMEPRKSFTRGNINYVKVKISNDSGIIPNEITDSDDKRFLGVFVRFLPADRSNDASG